MRFMRYFILGLTSVGIIVGSLANREMVTLTLMPEVLGDLFNVNAKIRVPLFVSILSGVAAGLLIGFVLEWLREMKHRVAVKLEQKKVVLLKREVDKLKSDSPKAKDDILALLDEVS
jgi:lipopolysaccharide assembly protein A